MRGRQPERYVIAACVYEGLGNLKCRRCHPLVNLDVASNPPPPLPFMGPSRAPSVRPISLLRISLLRLLDSSFPGISLWT